MLLIVSALRKEADPLISSFRLTRDMKSHAFPVFTNDRIRLIISGTGKLRAAIAATDLLSRTDVTVDESFLVNFGVCGSRDPKLPPGTLCVAHKISDADTGRDYYPDYPLSMDDTIPRASDLCVPRPVSDPDDKIFENAPDAQICDMESAGIMEAAGRYLPPHRILILRIVSDLLSPRIPDTAILDRYLNENLAFVLDILRDADGSVTAPLETSDTVLRQRLSLLSRRLSLTTQMEKRLLDATRKAILFEKDVDGILDISQIRTPEDKRERKETFERIIHRLEAGAITDHLH
ncbi:MAG: hypothetical protein JW780_03185 [Clostridiales bacterium]|nr:hypothetical protein [Clostridiales bacterium]